VKTVETFINQSSCQEVANALFENAIDSMKHALEHYKKLDKTKENLKYIIIHVGHSAELLLKSMLAEYDAKLLIDKRSRYDRTIDYRYTIKLLQDEGLLIVEDTDRQRLEQLREFRNRIEHFIFDISVPQAQQIVDGVISHWFWLLRESMDRDIHDYLDHSEVELVLNADQAYRRHVVVAHEEIENQKGSSEKDAVYINTCVCEDCLEETVLIDAYDGKARCHYCGSQFFVEECVRCGTPILLSDRSDDPIRCTSCWQDIERE